MNTNKMTFDQEVAAGERFEFGKNWQNFLSVLNEDRIKLAEQSLTSYLGDVSGKTFLDIGSGSGLFSLVAKRLGAKVHSFDYDTQSFACTQELKRRYFPNDNNWKVEQGSVLDAQYIASLGKFDIVYSWGVLHHTGKMWEALTNAEIAVADNGRLFISLYNDQGIMSKIWTFHKKNYNSLPKPLKNIYAFLVMGATELIRFVGYIAALKPMTYIRFWTTHNRERGMSHYYDLIDWIGGYPFEVSKPEEIFDFFRAKGYNLQKLRTCGGKMGCNEYIFAKNKR